MFVAHTPELDLSSCATTEAKALAVIPWTSPSRSRVIIVTPVAKEPIAFRNSTGITRCSPNLVTGCDERFCDGLADS